MKCADRVSVGLYFGANGLCQYEKKICRAEQKYMPFFGTVAQRFFWKKIQSTEESNRDQCYTFNGSAVRKFSLMTILFESRMLDRLSIKVTEKFSGNNLKAKYFINLLEILCI